MTSVGELQRDRIEDLQAQLARCYEDAGKDARVIYRLEQVVSYLMDEGFQKHCKDEEFVSQFISYYCENNDNA